MGRPAQPRPYLPNLQKAMEQTGVQIEAIAVVSHRSLRTIHNWFMGRGEPSASQALDIRDNLFPQFTVDYLFQQPQQQEKSFGIDVNHVVGDCK